MIYEATLSYIGENGKTAKESYIIENCNLFCEVEAKMLELNGDSDVVAIKRSNIKEIANQSTNAEDKIYIATLVDVFLTDDGGEKEMKYNIAFFSKDMDSAHVYIKQYASQGYNMGIKKIVESKFIDVLK